MRDDVVRVTLPVLQRASVWIEKRIAEHGGSSCDGCHTGACCYDEFTITLAEGIVLADYMTREKPAEVAGVTMRALARGEAKGRGPCPLLKDGLCLAYNARPSSCRLQYSSADPALCEYDYDAKRTKGSLAGVEVKIHFNAGLRHHQHAMHDFKAAAGNVTGRVDEMFLRAMEGE